MKQSFLSQCIAAFTDREIPFHAAALAFYLVIALPAFVILLLSLAGVFITDGTLHAWLLSSGFVSAEALENMDDTTLQFSSLTTVVSILVILWSGSALFLRLQQGLRSMWNIQLDVGKGVRKFIAKKGLAMVAALIFIVTIIALYLFVYSMNVATDVLSDTAPMLAEIVPIARLIQFLLLVAVIMLMYSLLGDAALSWQPVLSISVVVAIVVWLMQYGSQQYIANMAAVTWYGAAGSVIALLFLLYMLGMVFYVGAVCIQVMIDRNTSWTLRARPYAHTVQPLSWWDRVLGMFSSYQ